MVPVGLRIVPTVPRTIALATTHPRGLTHVAPQSRTVTAARAWVKRTTQRPGHTEPRSKVTMPAGAGEARRFRKTAIPHSPNIKRPLKGLLALYKLRTVLRLWAG